MNPLFIVGQKIIFSSFLRFWFWRYSRFRRFFLKNMAIKIWQFFFSSVLRFWFWRYCCFTRFLSKQYGNQTLDVAPFQHLETCHWKTLDEYV